MESFSGLAAGLAMLSVGSIVGFWVDKQRFAVTVSAHSGGQSGSWVSDGFSDALPAILKSQHLDVTTLTSALLRKYVLPGCHVSSHEHRC